MSMTTKPNLTPAQRAAVRLALRRDGEWRGRVVPYGRTSEFLRRLVGTGAVTSTDARPRGSVLRRAAPSMAPGAPTTCARCRATKAPR